MNVALAEIGWNVLEREHSQALVQSRMGREARRFSPWKSKRVVDLRYLLVLLTLFGWSFCKLTVYVLYVFQSQPRAFTYTTI